MTTQILIIEDEIPASNRLRKMIASSRPDYEVTEVLDSVAGAVKWLNNFQHPDLIFMDIQLADGISFDIFNQIGQMHVPVIFTTAYDQYMLKAFKVNSIDYLLKPIDPEELDAALTKFERISQQSTDGLPSQAIQQLLQSIQQPNYKERFLVKSGQQLSYMPISKVAYFYSENGLVYLQSQQQKKHVVDYTLDQLHPMLNPNDFFRINRKLICQLDAVRKIHTYFNSRLKLELEPAPSFEVIVSRDRVPDFKGWLDK